MVGDRVIFCEIFDPRLSAESTGNFFNNHFLAIFGGHLEFLHKTHKKNIYETLRFGYSYFA